MLLIPFLLTGNVMLWTPQELAFRMRVFEPILENEQAEGGDIIITPYLKLDKEKDGHQVPEDIRLMVEPRRKPTDFLGVQLQVAVNKGPNGNVPYMYAVFLCRGKGDTFHKLSSMGFDEFVREPGGDKEYGYVVVRQQTSGHGVPHDGRRRASALPDGERKAACHEQVTAALRLNAPVPPVTAADRLPPSRKLTSPGLTMPEHAMRPVGFLQEPDLVRIELDRK